MRDGPVISERRRLIQKCRRLHRLSNKVAAVALIGLAAGAAFNIARNSFSPIAALIPAIIGGIAFAIHQRASDYAEKLHLLRRQNNSPGLDHQVSDVQKL